jgi:hypothetical protein
VNLSNSAREDKYDIEALLGASREGDLEVKERKLSTCLCRIIRWDSHSKETIKQILSKRGKTRILGNDSNKSQSHSRRSKEQIKFG